MALSVLATEPFFDADIHDQPVDIVFAAARAGSVEAMHLLLGRPTFKVRAKTTDNAAASQVLDLTDQGVDFDASTLRKIRFRSTAVSDNDRYVQEWEQYVLGGTTPVLLGSAKLLNAFGIINGTAGQYGLIKAQATYSGDTATAVAANSTAGSSLGDTTTNTTTFTHPIARATPKNYWVNASADDAALTEQVTAHIIAATSTTASIFTTGVSTTAFEADGFQAGGTLTAYGFIVPPPSVALVMNSNNVEVHCGHDASDDIYHTVEVFVGPNEFSALVAD